jgi:hypothetical protein
MLLVQHDHMVKRVSPDTADDPLTIGILPRRSRGYFDLFNTPVAHAILKRLSVDRVPIPQEITRCGVPREGNRATVVVKKFNCFGLSGRTRGRHATIAFEVLIRAQ